MASETIKKRAPVFVKVSSLRPDTTGHNLKVKVIHFTYHKAASASQRCWLTYSDGSDLQLIRILYLVALFASTQR